MSFNFDALQDRISEALPGAIRDGLKIIKDDAVERAPEEDGDLKASAKVDEEIRSDSVSYVGTFRFEAPWARKEEVHLYYDHHGKGGAKYAELALATKGPDAVDRIGERIREALS